MPWYATSFEFIWLLIYALRVIHCLFFVKLIKADQRLFQAADVNQDGTLDKEEYRKFCSPEEFADMLPILIENTLEEKDRNRDGFIDFDEFIGDAGLAVIFFDFWSSTVFDY